MLASPGCWILSRWGRPGILSGGRVDTNVNCLRRSTLLSLVFKAVLVTVGQEVETVQVADERDKHRGPHVLYLVFYLMEIAFIHKCL